MQFNSQLLLLAGLNSDTPSSVRDQLTLVTLAGKNEVFKAIGMKGIVDESTSYSKDAAEQTELARKNDKALGAIFQATDPETNKPENPAYAAGFAAFKANVEAGKLAEAGINQITLNELQTEDITEDIQNEVASLIGRLIEAGNDSKLHAFQQKIKSEFTKRGLEIRRREQAEEEAKKKEDQEQSSSLNAQHLENVLVKMIEGGTRPSQQAFNTFINAVESRGSRVAGALQKMVGMIEESRGSSLFHRFTLEMDEGQKRLMSELAESIARGGSR
ncbi:MAG: hypothetical protein AAFX02_05305 [Pseudomonadota bacterium]